MIRGFFRNDAGFLNAHLISEEKRIDETIEFLVDTGASRTTLLDKDAIYLGIEYDKLRESEQRMRYCWKIKQYSNDPPFKYLVIGSW